MNRFVSTTHAGGIATVRIRRGKVNALNPDVVSELTGTFASLRDDAAARAVVLTGEGSFFSFGFDIPELISCSKQQFTAFLNSFTSLYRDIFLFPKPVVAALNGHAVAGGCMLALACDARIMTTGRARIGLNEITFGASIFAGSLEILRFAAGSAAATEILYSGRLYTGEDAVNIGLIQEAVPAEDVLRRSAEVAAELSSRSAAAFASLKRLLRAPAAELMDGREAASIAEFVEIWYSEPAASNLRKIEIR